MKENENEEQLKENKEQEPKIQIIEDNNIQSGDNNHLESLDTLINPDSGPYLKTVRTLLTEEPKYKEGYDDKIILQVEEKESSTPRIIFNIKNNVLVFCLLYSSFMNYNFLYFPYIILGFALSACLYKNKNPKIYHFKQISELIILIYSFLLLAFKAVFIVLTKNDNELAVNNKKLLINLGVKLLRDKESIAYLVSSLLTEFIIIVISLVSYIISKTFTDYKLEDDTKIKGISKREMFNLLIKHLIINYFILLFNAILNTSIFTLLYLGLALVLFFFTARNSGLNRMLYLFKSYLIIIYVIMIFQIFLINLFNCYRFEDVITDKQIKIEEKTKYYSIYTQIGIKALFKDDSLDESIFHYLSYFFTIISLISVSASNYVFTINIAFLNFVKEEKFPEKKIRPKNLFEKIKLSLKLFFTSPSFILHICRIFGIAYLYFFRNFFAIFVFIWLFFSFLYLHALSNKLNTYIIICFIFVSFILFHVANIDGFLETEQKVYYHLSLNKINERLKYYAYYFCLNLYLFFNILFIFSTYNLELIKKEHDLKKIKTEESIKEDKEEDLKANLITEEHDKKEPQSEENIISTDGDNKNEIPSEESLIKTEDDDNKNENIIVTSKEEDALKLLNQRRVTQLIKTKKRESSTQIEKKYKIDRKTYRKLKFINIIGKILLSHIDKISLIVMYFICINSINIIHLILVIIFMIQLLFPKLIVLIAKYLMIIMQVLYLIEFVVDIFKKYYLDSFNEKEKLIQIFMKYDSNESETSVEIFFYILVYSFYMQYKLYDSIFYKKVVSDEKVTLTNYILVKFDKHPLIKDILFFIGKVLNEIYIFVLILLFIFFDTYFEINLLFEIKLIIFFLIVFQFLISMQNKQKNYISLILNWFFLCYCSLNSFLVFGYQIICLPYFKEDSEQNNETNLPSIGFPLYKDRLYYKFLPHFICNFISVLFLWEMERILLKSNNSNIFENINQEIIIEKDDEQKKEEIENKGEERATTLYENNKKKMSALNFVYYIYNIEIMFTKFYWLFLFIILGVIFTTYDLSILIILYILIFGIIYIRMFYQIITKLDNFTKKDTYFISKLIRYNLIELNRHEQQNRYFRTLGYEYLLMVSLISYILFYSFGIFHQAQNGCDYVGNNQKAVWEGCDNRHKKIYISSTTSSIM